MDLNDLLERFGKLPRVQRLAVIGLALVLFVGLFWTLAYSPTAEEMDQLEVRNGELIAEKEKVKRRAENRDKFEAELQELTNQLREALRELPNEREIPELLKKISSVGKKVGLEVRRFQPLPERKQEYYADVPVSLQVVGSYHEVAMFFDRLSKLGRIVYVQDIDMQTSGERAGKQLLKVEGKAVTFRFLTEEERESAKSGKGKGKRRKR